MRNIDLLIKEARGWKNLRKQGKDFMAKMKKHKALSIGLGATGIIGAGIGVNMLMKGNGSDKKFREKVMKMPGVKSQGLDPNKAVKAKYKVN